MQKKVRSVRISPELEDIDLSGIIHECEKFMRDLESATMLKTQGNKEAADALVKAREAYLGKRVGMKVWEARVRYGERMRLQNKQAETD